jgi:hypothetical protein
MCKKDEEPGHKQFKIPLNFTNGVNTQLEIKVFQTIPDLEFSSTELDFNETKVGFVKIIYLRLENNKVVPAESNFLKNKTGKPKSEVFHIFPESGLLQPGGKQNIKVMFIPNAGRKFTQSLGFKIKSNEVSKFLKVKGESSFPKVNFNTTLISIDSTLP